MMLGPYIRSNMVLTFYDLQGQVTQTILSGQTADTSPFVQHGWYDWIKYYDNHAKHPELKEVYGHWFDLSVGIRPGMTSKILKQKTQVLHLSTFHGLNEDELADPGEQEL